MTVTIAIGDIHGRHDLLSKLLAYVEAFGADRGGATIITLGDYVDRGPHSRQVLDLLMKGPRYPGNRFVHLQGNHDAVMLAACTGNRVDHLGFWLRIGGGSTLDSYCPGGWVPDEMGCLAA